MTLRAAAETVAVAAFAVTSSPTAAARPAGYRIEHVTDGDTVVLRNGQRVRLVQTDTPEVFFGVECFGRQASAETKALLPPGTRVNLLAEPGYPATGKLRRPRRCSPKSHRAQSRQRDE